MTTAANKCVSCGGKVEGSLSRIPLTLFCFCCCEERLATNESPNVTIRSAVEYHRCSEDDLCRLSSLRTMDAAGLRVRHYLTAEVRYLGCFKKAEEMMHRKEQEQKKHQEMVNRRQKVLKKLQITDAEFESRNNKILMIFLLENFMKQRRPIVNLEDLKIRRAAMPRVQEILRRCPGAHPGAAFDYCVKYPDVGPAEFQDLKDKIRRVFFLEGRRILSHLNDTERLNLWETPLQGEVFQSKEGREEIRQYLSDWTNSAVADKIMHHPLCQRRIDRGGETWQVAAKLLQFWNERHDTEKRERRLEKAFAAKGRPLPFTMPQCRKYITGKVDYDIQELILLDFVHWKLHEKRGHGLDSDEVRAAERQVMRLFRAGQGKQQRLAFNS